MKSANFASDLSDAQWTYLEPMLPSPARTGRPRTPHRNIIKALLYVAKSGCHWHLLPKNFAPYKTVFHVFRAWTQNGTLTGIHDRLRAYAREQAGRRSRPTAAIIDSQTVRSVALPSRLAAEVAGGWGGSGEDFANHLKGLRKDLDVQVVKRSNTAKGLKCCRGAGWWSTPSGGTRNVGAL
jgi:transposase